MKSESIKELKRIVKSISDSNIKSEDKTELIILLHQLFQVEEYKENRKLLQRRWK